MERMQTQNAPPFPLATLEAVLERITYANEETGYTIARVTPARGSGNGSGTNDLLTVVGNLLGVQPGESLRLQGRWTSHPQYGRQFEVQHYTTVLPATSQGIPQDSPERIKAGLQFTLSEATEDGHCYLPADELTSQAAEILGVEAARAERCLDQLVAEQGVVRETLSGGEGSEVTAIYLVPFHRAEGALASGLLRLIHAPGERLPAFQTVNWEVAFGWLEQETSSALAPEQAEAVRLALTERVAVLTGGPGCGKSYTVRAIVTLARAKWAKVLLTAPTGRAAKRLEELTGAKASTLHRLLQLRPGGAAAYDREHPLDADLVVVG